MSGPRVRAAAVAALACVIVGGCANTTRPSAVPDGRTVMTLQVPDPDGATADNLESAREILLGRLKAAHLVDPRVTVVDSHTVVVSVAGTTVDGGTLRPLVAPGDLSFRAVLGSTAMPAGRQVGSSSGAAAETSSGLTAVAAKLGPAYNIGKSIVDPSQVNAQTLTALAPFGQLTGQEVATLPTQMQYAIPTITCRQLNARPRTSLRDPLHELVACASAAEADVKYKLDVAKVRGNDLADAAAQSSSQGSWQILLKFNAAGQNRWTALTRDATAQAARDGEHHQVAIVLDGMVLTAPAINAVISGDAVISGSGIDRVAAEKVANLLKYGTVPVVFQIASFTNESTSPR
jgi:preprotein translocase subunit SecD